MKKRQNSTRVTWKYQALSFLGILIVSETVFMRDWNVRYPNLQIRKMQQLDERVVMLIRFNKQSNSAMINRLHFDLGMYTKEFNTQ